MIRCSRSTKPGKSTMVGVAGFDLRVTRKARRFGGRVGRGSFVNNTNMLSISIYNRALTASDVYQNCNALKFRFSGAFCNSPKFDLGKFQSIRSSKSTVSHLRKRPLVNRQPNQGGLTSQSDEVRTTAIRGSVIMKKEYYFSKGKRRAYNSRTKRQVTINSWFDHTSTDRKRR